MNDGTCLVKVHQEICLLLTLSQVGPQLTWLLFAFIESATNYCKKHGENCMHVHQETGALALWFLSARQSKCTENILHYFDWVGLQNCFHF
jgi:hypothetical protein